MKRILVTPRSATRGGHPALEALKDSGFEVVFCRPGALPTEEELLAKLPGCVGYLAGVEKVSAKVLETAKELRVISRNGTGADAIDVAAAERLGIKVLKSPGRECARCGRTDDGLDALPCAFSYADRSIRKSATLGAT